MCIHGFLLCCLTRASDKVAVNHLRRSVVRSSTPGQNRYNKLHEMIDEKEEGEGGEEEEEEEEEARRLMRSLLRNF